VGNYFFNHQLDRDVAYQKVLENKISETDWCMTNREGFDYEMSPTGCGMVSVAETATASDWFDLSDEEYKLKKEKIANQLLDKYNKRFPGLKDHIVVHEFATPKTMKRFTNNHNGSVYGLAQTTEQSNSKRLRNRTPIEGLFLTGAWTWSGGGYEGAMMTGVQTAQTVMQEMDWSYEEPRIRLHKNVPSPILQKKIPDGSPVVSVNIDETEISKHFRYKLPIRVYGDDLNSRGNADASAYIRYLDRARMEAIEEICRDLGKESWLTQYVINVYRIETRCATVIGLNDRLQIRTGFRKISSHRASFDQQIVNVDTNDVVGDACVEVLFLDNDMKLVEVPEGVSTCDCTLSDFSSDRADTLPFSDEEHFPFRTRFRVYYEDTDCQQITFHVSYVRFCERALFDLVRTIWPDMTTTDWMKKNKVSVSRLDIRYLNSSVLGDKIEVKTGIMKLTKYKLIFGQRIVLENTGRVLADATTEVEFRDNAGKVVTIPRQLVDVSKANIGVVASSTAGGE